MLTNRSIIARLWDVCYIMLTNRSIIARLRDVCYIMLTNRSIIARLWECWSLERGLERSLVTGGG
jgi:hypothetical protein